MTWLRVLLDKMVVMKFPFKDVTRLLQCSLVCTNRNRQPITDNFYC